jgi:hypothetical protein
MSKLIRIAIQSPNYVLGLTGWSINKDGSAEFNNLTIRGTFFGINFILSSLGLFLYSSAPALGNLIASISNAAADSFGNPVQPVIATYSLSDGSYVALSPGGIGGGLTSLFIGSGNSAESKASQTTTQVSGAGVARKIVTTLRAPRVSGESIGAACSILLFSPAADLSQGVLVSLIASDDGITFSSINMTQAGISLGAATASAVTASTANMTCSLLSTRVSAAGQTVSSLAPTFVSLTGLLLPLDAGKWQIRVRVFISANASAGQWQLQMTVPAGTSGNYSFKWESAAGAEGLNVNRTSFAVALGGPNPSVAGAYWATIEGVVTLTNPGNINIKGATTIAVDTFDVESASFFEAFPVL